jgi:antitoxin HicB
MAEVLIQLHLEPLDEGGYVATSEDVPGLVVEGRTIAETMEFAQDAVRKLYESYLEHGDPVPPKLKEAAEGEFELLVPVAV